jgi:hypothetical protein
MHLKMNKFVLTALRFVLLSLQLILHKFSTNQCTINISILPTYKYYFY